jgi:hypothetical protein
MFGWAPKVKFQELVRLMVDADWKLLQERLDGRLVREFLVGG